MSRSSKKSAARNAVVVIPLHVRAGLADELTERAHEAGLSRAQLIRNALTALVPLHRREDLEPFGPPGRHVSKG